MYQKAHTTDPDSVAALTNLAAVRMAMGNNTAAVTDCDLAIQTAQRVHANKKLHARACERKGKALRACGRLQEVVVAAAAAAAAAKGAKGGVVK